MEVTLFDLVVGVIAIVSLVFNFFQLYKDKINRQKLSDERRLHETILTGLWQNMNEGAKSLEQLKRKGAKLIPQRLEVVYSRTDIYCCS